MHFNSHVHMRLVPVPAHQRVEAVLGPPPRAQRQAGREVVLADVHGAHDDSGSRAGAVGKEKERDGRNFRKKKCLPLISQPTISVDDFADFSREFKICAESSRCMHQHRTHPMRVPSSSQSRSHRIWSC
jgi:hypothetical protein